MKVVQHYLAAYNKDSKTQKCVMCGETIHDYNNTTNDANLNITGWDPGKHYVTEGNPKSYSTTKPSGKVNVMLCKLVYNKK